MRTLCKKPVTGLSYILLAAMCFTQVSPLARAQQTVSITEHSRWKARITEIKTVPTAPDSIPILHFTPQEVWIDGSGPVQYVRIKWTIDGAFQSVSINGKQLNPKPDGSFDVNFGFTNNEKAFKLTILDQTGKTYQGTYRIVAVVTDKGGKEPLASRYRFSVGMGYTSIKYTQTGVTDFSESALTLKGGISYRLVPDKFDLSLSTFMNALVIKSNGVNSLTGEEYTIRYLGVNARVGYHLLDAPSPFRIVLNGGLYYNTSIGSIGFSNMYGPQLYPEFSYILPNGNAFLLYVKFSPALFQQKIDFSKNKEIATGLYYVFPLNPKLRMSVGFDISKLDLATDTDAAATTTYSLSTGLSF